MNHDGVVLDPGRASLVEDDQETGGVGADFIGRDVEVPHHRDAFEVGRHLLEGAALGGFEGEVFRIHPGVAVAHAVFALGGDDPEFG